MESESLVRTGHTKQTKSSRIEQQHWTAHPVDQWISEEDNQSRQNGNCDITPFIDRGRWKSSNHDVAGDSTGIACNEAENQNAKCIKPVLDGGDRAAQREDESSSEIKNHQKSGDHMVTVYPNRVHAETQA